MKRASTDFEAITSIPNLRLAFLKASRGKHASPEIVRFRNDLDRQLNELQSGLIQETVQLGVWHQFIIHDPKRRIITAPCFRERVIHHAIINVLEADFERWLIDDTFACRRGKGREAAVLRGAKFARRYAWAAKLDIRQYFDSIPHQRLIELVSRRFRDRRLIRLLARIIDCYRGAAGQGLPIGSLTSQHFANFYLGWFDRFVKESLRLRGYVRYMDDMILFGKCAADVRQSVIACDNFLTENLHLSLKVLPIRPCSHGIPFLGCKLFPGHTTLSRRSKLRWQRRVAELFRLERLGLIDERTLQDRLTAATSFAQAAQARSWRFRSAVLQRLAVGDR